MSSNIHAATVANTLQCANTRRQRAAIGVVVPPVVIVILIFTLRAISSIDFSISFAH